MPTTVPENPSLTWVFVVVILAVLGLAAWLIRMLFKRVLDMANQRAEDYKEALSLERTRSTILEERYMAALPPVAEAMQKVLSGLPVRKENGP